MIKRNKKYFKTVSIGYAIMYKAIHSLDLIAKYNYTLFQECF